jgi:hypothetical protein
MARRVSQFDIVRSGTMLTLLLVSILCAHIPSKIDMLSATPSVPIIQWSSLTDDFVAPVVLVQKLQVQSLALIVVAGILLAVSALRLGEVSAYRVYQIGITSETLVEHFVYTQTTSSRF